MEYQKIISFLDNTPNHLFQFRGTKNWIQINDQSRGGYNTNSDIRFKTTMLKSRLSDYSDAYILVKGGITISGAGDDAAARQADEKSRGVILKDCSTFIICKSEIDNTEIDNAKDIDIVMPMYNLIEHSENYSKTPGSLWKYCKGKPNDNLEDPESFKSKMKITRNTPADGNTKDLEIIVPLKYLSTF